MGRDTASGAGSSSAAGSRGGGGGGRSTEVTGCTAPGSLERSLAGLGAPGPAWCVDKPDGLPVGKGPWPSVQAGKGEGTERNQRSPGVGRVEAEGLKLRVGYEHVQEGGEAPREALPADRGRGAGVKVVEGEVVQGRSRPCDMVGAEG